MNYACYILNHLSHKSLNGQIPLIKLYGVTPDTSILMMYTFYQSVYFASHNQSFSSTSEEKHVFWVGFGEHVGDAIAHNFWIPHPTRSDIDLLFILLMILIPTSTYFQT